VVMKSTIFWDITPCCSLSVNWIFERIYRLHLQGLKISLARNQRESRWKASFHLLTRWFHVQLIFSTLKMEAVCSSETSVGTQRTIRRYIPHDGTLLLFSCLLWHSDD
jgi:hypothetical protein